MAGSNYRTVTTNYKIFTTHYSAHNLKSAKQKCSMGKTKEKREPNMITIQVDDFHKCSKSG